MYSNFTVEIRKRLREFEEIEISRQSCRGDGELQGGKLQRFRPRIWPLYFSVDRMRSSEAYGGKVTAEQKRKTIKE